MTGVALWWVFLTTLAVAVMWNAADPGAIVMVGWTALVSYVAYVWGRADGRAEFVPVWPERVKPRGSGRR